MPKEIDALPERLIAAIALERADAGVDEAVPLEPLPAGQLGAAQVALEPLLLERTSDVRNTSKEFLTTHICG